MGMSQMCTGTGDYFRTSKPHSEKLWHVFITVLNLSIEVKIEEPSPLQLTILPDYHGAIPQPPLYKHCGGQLLDRARL